MPKQDWSVSIGKVLFLLALAVGWSLITRLVSGIGDKSTVNQGAMFSYGVFCVLWMVVSLWMMLHFIEPSKLSIVNSFLFVFIWLVSSTIPFLFGMY